MNLGFNERIDKALQLFDKKEFEKALDFLVKTRKEAPKEWGRWLLQDKKLENNSRFMELVLMVEDIEVIQDPPKNAVKMGNSFRRILESWRRISSERAHHWFWKKILPNVKNLSSSQIGNMFLEYINWVFPQILQEKPENSDKLSRAIWNEITRKIIQAPKIASQARKRFLQILLGQKKYELALDLYFQCPNGIEGDFAIAGILARECNNLETTELAVVKIQEFLRKNQDITFQKVFGDVICEFLIEASASLMARGESYIDKSKKIQFGAADLKKNLQLFPSQEVLMKLFKNHFFVEKGTKHEFPVPDSEFDFEKFEKAPCDEQKSILNKLLNDVHELWIENSDVKLNYGKYLQGQGKKVRKLSQSLKTYEVKIEALKEYLNFEDCMNENFELELYNRGTEILHQAKGYQSLYTGVDLVPFSQVLDDLRQKQVYQVLDQASLILDERLKSMFKKLLAKEKPDKGILKKTFSEKEIAILCCCQEMEDLLITGEYLWNNVENLVHGAKDFTFCVGSYFKAVETFLWEKIRKGSPNASISLKRNYATQVGSKEYERATMGNLFHFLQDNPSAPLTDPSQKEVLFNELRHWTNNIRNSNFHRDLIKTSQNCEFFRNATISLLKRLVIDLK